MWSSSLYSQSSDTTKWAAHTLSHILTSSVFNHGHILGLYAGTNTHTHTHNFPGKSSRGEKRPKYTPSPEKLEHACGPLCVRVGGGGLPNISDIRTNIDFRSIKIMRGNRDVIFVTGLIMSTMHAPRGLSVPQMKTKFIKPLKLNCCSLYSMHQRPPPLTCQGASQPSTIPITEPLGIKCIQVQTSSRPEHKRLRNSPVPNCARSSARDNKLVPADQKPDVRSQEIATLNGLISP